ncbi:hypothetical protein LBMAG18_07600 [Alphaproteobacteria bacterium]|nr:hypothetical protein LBMAG18_07600 [Alphaproteobacteria bacterium]
MVPNLDNGDRISDIKKNINRYIDPKHIKDNLFYILLELKKLEEIEHDKNSFSNEFLLFVKNISNVSKEGDGFNDANFDIIKKIFNKFKEVTEIDKAKDEEGNSALHHLAGFRFKDSISIDDDFFNLFENLINEKNNLCQTVIHKAFSEKNYRLAEIFLTKGAEIIKDSQGNYPYHLFSATKDSYEDDKYFLNKLIDTKPRSYQSLSDELASPRHHGHITREKNKKFLTELSKPKRKEIFFLKNNSGYNPIQYAIIEKNVDNSCFWLQYGLDEELINENFKFQILKFILQQKITNEDESNKIHEIFKKFYDKFYSRNKTNSIIKSDSKKLLLIEIAKKGNLDFCNEEFLEKIYKILFEKEKSGQFAYLLNQFGGNSKTEDDNKNSFDDNKNSLLHILLQNCSEETEYYDLQFLKSFIDSKNIENKTPFIIAIERGLNKFCNGFLDDKTNISSIIENYFDYMKCAIECGNIEIIRKLYEKNQNIINQLDRTPASYFQDKVLICALKSKNIKVIETLFEITEEKSISKSNIKNLFNEIINSKNPDIINVIIQKTGNLFDSYFTKRIFRAIDNYSSDQETLELILKSGITKEFSSTNSDKLFAAIAKKNNADPLTYTLYCTQDIDIDNKVKILELLALYQADTEILKDKIKLQPYLSFKSCFERTKRRSPSEKLNNCLIKIVSNKELHKKQFKQIKLSLFISDLYDNLLKVKQSNDTANSSQNNDSKKNLETELLKNLKFIQILQKIYNNQSIDLSEKGKRSTLFKEALKHDQASILSLKYLNGKSLEKFSFLENLSDEDLISMSKELAAKFSDNTKEIKKSKNELKKILNYKKKYHDQFSKKIITDKEIHSFDQMYQNKIEKNALLDCKSIIKMIGHANITEQDNDINDIIKKVSTEFQKPATSFFSAGISRLFGRANPVGIGNREVMV